MQQVTGAHRSDAQELPVMHDVASLAHQLPFRLMELHRLVSREAAAMEASDRLKPVPALPDTSELSEDIHYLRITLRTVTALKRQAQYWRSCSYCRN